MKKMGLNSKNFSKKISRDFAKAQRSVKRFSASIKRNLSRGIKIGLAGAIGAVGFAVKGFISEASKIENAVAAFQPLVGGVENAEAIVDKLNQTAATTPFQLENLSAATKTLLGFGAATQDTIIPVLRMLGDTAGGNSDKLNSIALAFGKIQAKGKTSMKEINQLITAGVPIVNELNKTLGVSADELFEMIRAGDVTSDVITQTFQNMTSEGGIFFKGMEIASKTLTGRFSTFKDNVALTAAAFGNVLLPKVKEFIDKGITLAGTLRTWATENKELIQKGFQRFLDTGKRVIMTVGKIAKVISKVLKFLAPLIPVILAVVAAWKVYKAIMIILAIKQAIVNAVMAANPIALIIIGVVALIAAIVSLVKNWDTVKAALIKIWDAIKVAGVAVWEGIKKAFTVAVDFMKGVMFTFADILLTTYGNIFKAIIKGASKVGKFLGFDTSGIDAIIEKIEAVQANVRAQSFIGGRDRGNMADGGGVVTQGERVSRSISESTNRSEITVRNDGTTDVETDSGSVRPGGSIVLQPSG
jgi:tape measure domain-containing protein